MMKIKTAFCLSLAALVGAVEPPTPMVSPLNYTHNGTDLQGFLSVPEGNMTDLLPAVVIIPDWDGVNLYEQQRATMVAQELGWVGFAADIYGADLHEVPDFSQRIQLASFYRGDPALFAGRIQAAIDMVRDLDYVDPDKVAVVGYCFGGTGVLQYAMQGVNDVSAIVSVHGGLRQVLDQPADYEVTPPILVLSGGEDDASSDIMKLEMTLDMVNATWEITRYSDIVHAWTDFHSDAYDAFADMRTWDSMVHWLSEVFGFSAYMSMEPDAAMVEAVNYTDIDGQELTGYLAIPNATMWNETMFPAAVLIPDWDGVNEYEKKRATMLAELGYVGFAADIYGSDLQEDLPVDTRREQSSLYRGNGTLFVQRMARAVELLKEHPSVDNDNIFMFGYCFGGTGVIYYAFSDRDDIKAVASFHGGLRSLPESIPEKIVPYVLVLSGGADDQHGNQTTLEEALDKGDAKWEISRWSEVEHGFTSWTSSAYNPRADIRSWEQTLTAMEELMMMPDPTEALTSAPTTSPTTPPTGGPPDTRMMTESPTEASKAGMLATVLSTVSFVAAASYLML